MILAVLQYTSHIPCPGSALPYYFYYGDRLSMELSFHQISNEINEGSTHVDPDQISGEMPSVLEHSIGTRCCI